MQNIYRALCKLIANAALCGLVTMSLASYGAAQQLGEPLPEIRATDTPVPQINSCYRVDFDKSGSQYSGGDTLRFDAAFQGPASGCLGDKMEALKPAFLYRYYSNPNDVPPGDLRVWRKGCESHCDWLQSNNNITILDRATWGAAACINVPTSLCDENYSTYVAAWQNYKKELPLLSAAEYMDLSSAACAGNKCSDALAACKVRCNQMLSRQCYWQSWCSAPTSPIQQRGFCSSDTVNRPCADRVYADDSAVEQFMASFFGLNQWPSGETDVVLCQDAVPPTPSNDWKNSNCAGMTAAQCDAKFRDTFSHLRGRCATGSFALDNKCSLLTKDQAKGCQNVNAATVQWLASSPISLIWKPGISLRESASIVNFKLDDSSADTWYRWYGSAETPLLVYDPKHSGRIESAHQLFGSWTFGGQRVASLALGMIKPQPWSSGYEALATLDSDGNGVIKGEELAPLGLWFDANRDARAQDGEVRDIRAVGVVSLSVGPQKRDGLSGDVSVTKGFERLLDERLESGQTIDWFSEGARTMQQLIVTDQLRVSDSFARSAEVDESREQPAEIDKSMYRLPPTNDPRGDYAADSKITGVWTWGSPDKTDLASRQGIIAIRELKNGKLEVVTLGELGVRDSAGATRALQKFYLMTGSVSKGADGSIKISFKDPRKGSSETTATLDEHAGILRGQTTQRIVEIKGTTSINYSWEARKALR